MDAIRTHPFLSHINWNALSAKTFPPPWKPNCDQANCEMDASDMGALGIGGSSGSASGATNDSSAPGSKSAKLSEADQAKFDGCVRRGSGVGRGWGGVGGGGCRYPIPIIIPY